MVPCVPTGMNAGVSKWPCAVVTRPRRADWSRAEISKRKDIDQQLYGRKFRVAWARVFACPWSADTGKGVPLPMPPHRWLFKSRMFGGEAGLFLFEAVLRPFVFVNDEAIEEVRLLIRFQLAVFLQERGGDEEFVVG